jgi:XkdW protein
MTLYEKILSIYPELSNFNFGNGVITLQNDSDGKGDYIKNWSHPTLPKPTQEQLDAV